MTFKPGQSGNPAGRPKGIIDRRSKYRALLDEHADAIIQKLVEQAKSGDPAAIRLCMDRLLPKSKPDTGIDFPLPEGSICSGQNMQEITDNLTLAVASGSMPLEDAERFALFLKRQRIAADEARRQIRHEGLFGDL